MLCFRFWPGRGSVSVPSVGLWACTVSCFCVHTTKTSINILTLYGVYLEQQIININRCSI